VSLKDDDGIFKIKLWKNLLFGLGFFHAVVQERRKFGAIGWNITYEFNDNDLKTSMEMIRNFLTNGKEIPWDAMKFMTGDINYGGNVTDDFDRKLLQNILEIYQTEELSLNPDYRFSPSGIYFCPQSDDYNDVLKYIDNLPIEDEPEIFGMHQNANIIFRRKEGNKLIKTVLDVQPRTSNSADAQGDEESSESQ
jgi:dynein heavy chain